MRFILTYEGPLPPNGRPEAKNRIRLELSPQLEQLWQYEHSLSELRAVPVRLRGPHGFIPIVTVEHFLVCQLEVTLLQRGDPGSVIHRGGGDLDNRLKTLFDSMGIPNADQLAGLPPPPPEVALQAAYNPPYYVLLEDDSRITRLDVRTEKLLRAGPPNDVMAVVVVTVRPTRVTPENSVFLGGWIS
jgi:hypothetical protein